MTISNIERGRALPRVGEVELFAQVLKIDVEDLGPQQPNPNGGKD